MTEELINQCKRKQWKKIGHRKWLQMTKFGKIYITVRLREHDEF